MQYTTLPHTDIRVSKICLGSMTWGNQNSEVEGHLQLDYAIDRGINFIDTAELYPVPATAETHGRTSEIIGSWLAKRSDRDKLVIASKIAGPGDYTAHIRTTGFSPSAIHDAIEKELKRLRTDYLDLFQLHWPERQTNTFGVRDYNHSPNDPWKDNFNEILHTLKEAMKSGKIRHVGLSNEKAWGTMRYLEEAKKHDLPRMITIQNSYSMLNRTFEGDLAEISIREGIGLLAYSPMAFGVLSGKYIEGRETSNSRLSLFPRFSRYSGTESTEATKQYLKLAKDYGMSLAQMSLAFVTQQPFLTSNIIGATTLDQLKENIESINLKLDRDILTKINAIHGRIPNPAP
ncbi:MAG: NADP(H)-dependent aldo-keto reductase [Flavobacteriaceae bacterium]|nr:NADP(H)-dependent aldo-keto reductase [Bacteroidia bacterium]MBT8287703.1 NADP(H)-dependent aldo-keto reductase [Bacteroidia bacterium]NNF73940.1 NADP(H)-dependent aldo-keto reductase [Flavobacteriaceae bacterium]NNK71699.1 NADP(H)-dependent aldo-keto reductase [Flavobacteriaceae bacterium]